MVSFELTPEQREIQAWVHEFALKEIRPHAAYYDRTEEFPWSIVKKAAQVGLYSFEFMQTLFADESGILPAIVAEELAWGDAGCALAIQGTGLPVMAIFSQGTPDQILKWIPACYGTVEEPAVAAYCVTEANAGSDVSLLRASAKPVEGGYLINGEKVFITNGGLGGVHVVVATLDPLLGLRGQATFIVAPGTPGLSMGTKYEKIGIRASHTASVVLQDVFVPNDCLLGGEEKLQQKLERARSGAPSHSAGALRTFELTRPIVGAQALGVARAAFEFALQYAKTRQQFGRPLIENQGISFKLADMALEIEATRALIWRALWLGKNGQIDRAQGSMAKLKAAEVAIQVTGEAIQICGGYGYMKDFPVGRWHQDSRIFAIFEGSSEIQKIVISRALAAL